MLFYLQLIETNEDKSKFEDIYNTYKNLMYYVAYNKLQNEQDAEDAVHHSFVKIAENIKKIEPVSSKTKQFVVTIVDNYAIDLLRKRQRHPVDSIDEEAISSQLLSEKQSNNLLAECILKLPSQQRMVIWLKYYYGFSLREISNILNISLYSAQKIDQRAKKRLEDIYLSEGGSL